MQQEILSSGRDTMLVAVPMVALLIASFFRLDEMFAQPKRPLRRKELCGPDKNGRTTFSDPDGRIRPAR